MNQSEKPNIVAVSAGFGSPSSTRKLTDRIMGQVASQLPDGELSVIEARELAHDLLNAATTGMKSPALQEALDAIAQADGLVAVSPIYNGAYSGLFKLVFDVLSEGTLRGVPVLLGATGGNGRHSLAIDQTMVPLFFYLRALPVPAPIFAATDDWARPASLDERIATSVASFVEMLGGQRSEGTTERVTPDSDFELGMDSEQMLRNVGK